jgi:hypothetical protein
VTFKNYLLNLKYISYFDTYIKLSLPLILLGVTLVFSISLFLKKKDGEIKYKAM